MIRKRRRRADRLAVDTAFAGARRRLLGRCPLDAGAERREPQSAVDLDGYGPEPLVGAIGGVAARFAVFAIALREGHLVELRAAQAPARRQKRDRLQYIG